MAKNCRNCVEMLKGCWDDGNTYCYRDKEEMLPKKEGSKELKIKKKSV